MLSLGEKEATIPLCMQATTENPTVVAGGTAWWLRALADLADNPSAGSPQPHGSAQPSLTPVPWAPTLSSGLRGHQTRPQCTHHGASKTLMHTDEA